MAFHEKTLYLKKSKLPDAGLGLFTRKEIKKGDCIVEYKGKLENWKDVKHTDGYNGYLYKLNSRYAINALNYKKTFGRYANDALGFSRVKGLRNNSEYDDTGLKCYIYASRNIKRGEEILVEYGSDYWKLLRKIRKEALKNSKQ